MNRFQLYKYCSFDEIEFLRLFELVAHKVTGLQLSGSNVTTNLTNGLLAYSVLAVTSNE
jgi:hypothetical protein